jgi:hypothetical protein
MAEKDIIAATLTAGLLQARAALFASQYATEPNERNAPRSPANLYPRARSATTAGSCNCCTETK